MSSWHNGKGNGNDSKAMEEVQNTEMKQSMNNSCYSSVFTVQLGQSCNARSLLIYRRIKEVNIGTLVFSKMARTLVVILFGILSGNEWAQGTTSSIALIRLKYVVSIATTV